MAFTSAGRGEENNSQIFFTKELSPIKAPENVKYERSGRTITISWDPLSLMEAQGFPTYIVTLRPISLVSNQSSDDEIISITTNETNIVNEELDPNLEYILVVSVATTIGETATDGG